LTVTFNEFLSADEQAQQTQKQSSDLSKAHTVRQGESLPDIAYQHYNDAAIWRPLAIANGLDDPRAINPGQTLRVPALPFTDPETLEVVT
jgi:nucleoid-associated protein YgaU